MYVRIYNVCMYCMHVCVEVCEHVEVPPHTFSQMYIYAHTVNRILVQECIQLHMHMKCVYMHACVHTHTHAHTCTVHVHACVYVCLHVL